jgi:hypothetical protein
MKRNVMLLALFVAAFSFSSIGSVSNADALGNYGCGNPDKRTHVNCLRALLSTTPFGLTVMKANPSKDGLGNYGCGNSDKTTHTTCLRRILDQHGAHLGVGSQGYAPGTAPQYNPGTAGGAPGSALGNYGCGNPDKQTHVNCLRGLLSSTPYGLTVQKSSPSKDGLGNYGCGNSNKSKHTNCLRRHLDQHGAHLQTNGAGPMNPPATFDDGLMGAPAMGAPGYAPGGPAMAPGSAAAGGPCADFAPGTPPRQSCERQHGGR